MAEIKEEAKIIEMTQAQKIAEFKKRRQTNEVVKDNSLDWDFDGLTFRSCMPTSRVEQDAELIYAEKFRQVMRNGGNTESQLLKEAVELGLVRDLEEKYECEDDGLEKYQEELRKKIAESSDELKSLTPDGSTLEEVSDENPELWEQMVEIANHIDATRTQLVKVCNDISETITNGSAEVQADNARLNYTLASCTLFAETNEPVWEDADAFATEKDASLVAIVKMQFNLTRFGIGQDRGSLDNIFPENRVLRVISNKEDEEQTATDEGKEQETGE